MLLISQVQARTTSLMLCLLQEAEPVRVTGKVTAGWQQQEDRDTYLTRLYGKLPHEGLRRTLKRSPYPRFSSPASPLSRKPRPRVVESVRGQTNKQTNSQAGVPDVQHFLSALRCDGEIL